jgi:hypothetical protein
MTKLLSLREDQMVPVMAVLKASHEQRRSLQRSDREQQQALHEQTLQQLKSLLNKVQMAKFIGFTEGMRMAHQQRMGRKGSEDGERGGGRPPMRDTQEAE